MKAKFGLARHFRLYVAVASNASIARSLDPVIFQLILVRSSWPVKISLSLVPLMVVDESDCHSCHFSAKSNVRSIMAPREKRYLSANSLPSTSPSPLASSRGNLLMKGLERTLCLRGRGHLGCDSACKMAISPSICQLLGSYEGFE